MPLSGKKILIGLTGGIACYKIPYLIRSLIKEGAEVRAVMTQSSTRFITPLTIESVCRKAVATSMFPEDQFVATRHIELAAWPDLLVIAPATANAMAKFAAGMCDDLLSTVVCACRSDILIAPAMNPHMWGNVLTQRNRELLVSELGWHIIGPEEGEMAEEQFGVGRMSEPEAIHKRIREILEVSRPKTKNRAKSKVSGRAKKKALEGKRIIVTAGPCREPIDPVRYISNRSSGKMGYAIAAAAFELGAETTLISGPTQEPKPEVSTFVQVETTEQMYKAVSSRFRRTDCLIMAAAPADFRPAKRAVQKMKKRDGATELILKPTVDILASLAKRKQNGQIMVGFALETEDGVKNAREKLRRKSLDIILLNDPSEEGAGFDHDTNRVTLISPGKKPREWPLLSKDEIAHKLLEFIRPLL